MLPGPRTPWALVRDLWDLGVVRYDALGRLHRRYGTVSQLGFPPLGLTFALGQRANEHILSTEPDAFSWGEALDRLRVVDGDTALVVTDGEEHKRRRKLVNPAFSIRRIHGYLPAMRDEADRTVSSWSTGQTFDLYDELRGTVRRIVARALFGDDIAARADDIGAVLEPGLEFLDRNPVRQIKIDLPGTGYRKALQARRRADDIVRDAIGQLGDEDSGTLLDALLASQDDDRLSELEVLDQVISLIAAGYHTTSAGVAWTLWEVLHRPVVLERLRDELESIDDLESLAGNTYLNGIVQESLRLHPPGPASARVTKRPVTIDGHTIPPGRLVLWSTLVTQTDPAHWDDVESYRPERWQDFEPAPYTFVPFGGGYRRCIGHLLATLEMKVIVATVVERAELTLLPGRVRPTGISAMRPRGVRVRVERVTPAHG